MFPLLILLSLDGGNNMSVGEMAGLCTAPAKEACVGYMRGIVEMSRVGTYRVNGADRKICVPAGVSVRSVAGGIEDLATEMSARFPANKQAPAVSFVLAALAGKFPCKPLKRY